MFLFQIFEGNIYVNSLSDMRMRIHKLNEREKKKRTDKINCKSLIFQFQIIMKENIIPLLFFLGWETLYIFAGVSLSSFLRLFYFFSVFKQMNSWLFVFLSIALYSESFSSYSFSLFLLFRFGSMDVFPFVPVSISLSSFRIFLLCSLLRIIFCSSSCFSVSISLLSSN